MKIPIERPCHCGGTYIFSAHGNDDFGQSTCSHCGSSAALIDPLSVSVTGERLLYRSKADLDSGDHSLSIVVGVMAVESFLTSLFLKLKRMESYAVAFEPSTAAQEAEWEREFPKSGGFPVPSDFVAQELVGMTFDEFVVKNNRANAIFSNLPNSSEGSPHRYFQDQLFKRRNRIAHWGYVNSSKAEAELCHTITVALISILRELDVTTDWVSLANKMAEAARAGVAIERRRLQEIIAQRQNVEPAEPTSQS